MSIECTTYMLSSGEAQVLILVIYVNREKRGRSAAHGGRAKRGEPGFALGIVVTGARELCEAVGTGAAG